MSGDEGGQPRRPQGRFARNVLHLTIGAGIAQALPFLLSPLLSRLYSPADYANFAIFLAASALGTVIATWRYELAIVLPERDEDAADLVRLCLSLVVAVGLALWLGLSLIELSGHADRLRHLSGSPPAVLVFAISFNGLYATLSYWGNRRGRYGSLAVARVVQGTVGVAIPIISTRWFDSNGLVFGNAMNSLAAALFLLVALDPKDGGLLGPWEWSRIRAVARRYAKFPRVTVPHGLMDALQNNLVVLLIERFFGPVVLGLYSFSYRMLKAPLGLFGSALSQVFYRDAAESMVRRGSIEADVKRVLKFLTLLAIPIFLIIVGIGSPFARQLFGAPWAGVGITLQLLAPWILMNFLLSPLSQAPLILGRQGTWFLISLGVNLLIVGVVVLAGLAGWSSTAMLLTLSTANVVYLGGALAWILAIARRPGSSYRSDA